MSLPSHHCPTLAEIRRYRALVERLAQRDGARAAAALLEVDPQTIRAMISGRFWPGRDVIARLRVVFGGRLWGLI